MTWRCNFVRAVAVTAFVIAAGRVQAAPCFQPSPGLAEQGGAYYELHAAPALSRAQAAALRALVERAQGDWRGEGSTLDCRGNERNPRPETRAFAAALAISTSDAQPIRLEERRVRGGSASRELTVLFGRRSSAKILEIDRDHLLATEKYRRATAPGRPGSRTSALWEIVHELRVSDRRLWLKTTRFVNGYLASVDQRRLRRL